MASRTIDENGGRLEPLILGTPGRRGANRGRSLAPAPKALAVSLGLFLFLSAVLVESRPAAAVSGTIELIQSGLKEPVAVAFAPDGRLFFVERPIGKISIIENGSLLPNPFYTFAYVSDYHDEGLLGLALDPGFPSTPWVYAYYTFKDLGNGTVYNRIVRIHANGNSGDSMEVLLDRIPNGEWHIGGPMKFGPDGKLYALTGDAYDPANAQNLTNLAGKVIRLNPDGSVPDDNPFVGNASANPYIYTYGHRNLFGIAFHPITGNAYVTENGPWCNDEVNLLIPGRNYGWGPNWTCYHPPADPYNTNQDGPDPVLPLIWYTPCCIAPTNAIFYHGPGFAAWYGDLFFGAYNMRNVHRVHLAPPRYDAVLSDEVVVTLPDYDSGGMVGLEQGLDGAIWFTSSTAIYRFYDTSLPPIASFTASASRPVVGDPVTFDGSGSYDPDGSIESYSWDFGDGFSATGAVVTHTYATHGAYEVTLVVRDFDNLTGSQRGTIQVLAPPSASFAFGPPNPLEGASVTFNASQSRDPDGNIADYRWDWGDGSAPSVSVSPVVEHTFATFGEYIVSLMVTDDDGLTNATSASVHVFAAPSAAFTFSPISPRQGQVVTLDGSASSDSDGDVVFYEWDFGDNTAIETGRNVSHAYTQPGTYVVTLRVTDSVGFWDTRSVSLVVLQDQPPVAVLAISPIRVNPGESVTFNASASTDPDGSIVSYFWDFGDETTEEGVSVVHAYAASGMYTVTVTVADNRGSSNVAVGHLQVNAPPTASFAATPALAYPGVPISFNASASADSDSEIVSYHWDFGDGTTAERASAVHTFADHGSFTVRLGVTDDLGAHGETTRTIEIGNRGPTIASTSPGAAQGVNVSETATFRVNASDPDGDPLTYAWTVDGMPVGVSSPRYEFVRSVAGTYVVKVVVSDGVATASHEWVVEVRDRTTPQGFPWSGATIVLGGTAVGVTLLVVALVAVMMRRRGSR